MPTWALRVGSAILQGLFGEEASKNLILTLLVGLMLIPLLFMLIILAPLAFLIIPLAGDDQLTEMQTYIAAVETGTATYANPQGVSIPWTEVVAVYAVLYDQEFEEIQRTDVQSLANSWLEYHEEDIWEQDEDGKPVYVETITWYTVKPLPSVLNQLGFEEEDIERVDAMIISLTEPEL